MSYVFRLASQNGLKQCFTPTLKASLEAQTNGSSIRQIRGKHSARQVNRLFNKNPARRRIMKRLNKDTIENELPIPEPKFLPVYSPPGGILSNGWSEPPTSDEFIMPSYPFHIERTKNKPNGAIGFLPVYTDIRIGGSKKTTIIRKVSGDKNAFISEMGIALGMPEKHITEAVRIRVGGNIEVNGIHTMKIRTWLAGLGF